MQETAFRCLGHRFTVHAQRAVDAAFVAAALAPFADRGGDASGTTSYRLRTTAPGEYSLFVDGRQVRVSPDPNEPLELLLWYVGEDTVRAETHHLLLHAGAVVAGDGRALLLPGPSGSGKSTTTFGLVRAGFGYLSDEFAAVDPLTGRVRAFPRPIALKSGSRALLPEAAAYAAHVPEDPTATLHVPADRVGPTVDEPAAPGWVVVPEHRPGARTTLTPLTAGETCVALSANTLRLADRVDEVLPVLARIAREVRGFRLVTGDLDEAVAVLTELTSPSEPAGHTEPALAGA